MCGWWTHEILKARSIICCLLQQVIIPAVSNIREYATLQFSIIESSKRHGNVNSSCDWFDAICASPIKRGSLSCDNDAREMFSHEPSHTSTWNTPWMFSTRDTCTECSFWWVRSDISLFATLPSWSLFKIILVVGILIPRTESVSTRFCLSCWDIM